MRYCNSVLCKVHNRKQTNQTRATSVTILMQDLLILIIQNYSLAWNVLYSLKNKNKEQVTLKKIYILSSENKFYSCILALIFDLLLCGYIDFFPSAPCKCTFHKSHVILTCILTLALEGIYVSEASMVPEGLWIGFFSKLVVEYYTPPLTSALNCPLALGF